MLDFFRHHCTIWRMGFARKYNDPNLPAITNLAARANNVIQGSKRLFHFKSEQNEYTISLKTANVGLRSKVQFKLKVGEQSAIAICATVPNLNKIDKNFDQIDFSIFDEDIQATLIKTVIEKELAAFSAAIGIDVELEDVSLTASEPDKFGNEIGINLRKQGAELATFNLKINDDLFAILVAKFEEIPPEKEAPNNDLSFDWYLQIGQTDLGLEVCKELTIGDIIFLDDSTPIRSGKYDVMGLNGVKMNGSLDGTKLTVESINFS